MAVTLTATTQVSAFDSQQAKTTDAVSHFTNPILPGGYPDPSICRDGEDFYIVNSTFEYFPALPIHHSKDLVNWQLIGHGLHRPEQASGAVNLVDVQSDGGIHAPTIRCHQGKFYIITTNVYQAPNSQQTDFVNFIITADNPAGPWSQPVVIKDAPGIDPDIFFDEDGRVWYLGTHSPEKPNFPGEGEIYLQELDPNTWQFKGPRHLLWRGACGGVWAEGPHLYKKDGKYYLLVAEGGTSFNHAVVVAASDKITGPYQSNARNPIFTTRHLSYNNWVHSTGHADMVELADGRWYMVMLGKRGDIGRESNMGRETHLVHMTWEREPFWWQQEKTLWPVVAPETGRVLRQTPVPFAGTKQYRKLSFIDNFDREQLNLAWNFRRVPHANTYSLTAKPGHLRLFTHKNTIGKRARASLMGVRQTASDFNYRAKMQFNPKSKRSEAGVMLFQKDNNYISFTLQATKNGVEVKAVHSAVGDNESIVLAVNTLGKQEIKREVNSIMFNIESRDDKYFLSYSINDDGVFTTHATTPANGVISRKYTGAYLGLYATSNGQVNNDFADFDWVNYQGFERH
ncbi:glycoside hydrolase family 43 protein [Psychrobium sp. MM17-31]|uniref:glycoside hydrolase family 43 protein n=1 Tax=Psychrobium sp. MM17-31 TaxID=2917758 RepID=UPI001EF5EC0A|nr:glycoside hydrolase family 43 protein [Psychrobium sp. MM17-31]MCG7530427.1 glycoside hydrolase family 43 protein [Psychrobium sp. MM17-31]